MGGVVSGARVGTMWGRVGMARVSSLLLPVVLLAAAAAGGQETGREGGEGGAGVPAPLLPVVLRAAAAAGGQETGREGGEGGSAEGSPPTLRTSAISAGIIVDGRLDDADWARAEVARGFVQRAPDEGEPATQPTEVRVLHGPDALYVGARLRDARPDSVVARMARRDEAVVADWFYVYLDSYHDRRSAFGFGVSAAGVQRDLRIADESRVDDGWDAVWASEVRRDARGWTAELRIPLSQLRFDRGERWGINFERVMARRNERSFWSPRPTDTDRFVSLFGRLEGVGALEPSRTLEVIPYTVGRLTVEDVPAGHPFRSGSQGAGAVGADLRMGVGRGMTLAATVNPDFGQVEADPATVNLTAFETFQQERRPFFLEGSDLFDLAAPQWPPFFYSRRIGRAPRGRAPGGAEFADVPRASTILGALKLSGKTEGGWTVGLLDAVTSREEVRWMDAEGVMGRREAEPTTNHAVARVARELRGGRTGIGLMAAGTHRSIGHPSLEHLHDAAYGFALDGWHRFADDAWELRWGLLGSHVRGSREALLRTQRSAGHYFQRPDADHVELDSTRTSLSGSQITLSLNKRSGSWRTGSYLNVTTPGYEIADFGFNPTLDHVQSGAYLRYERYTPGPLFRSWNLGSSTMVQSTTGGELKELTLDAGFNFTLLNYWGGGVWAMRHQPAWDPDALRGGPALRRPGRWMGNVRLHSDRRAPVSGNAFLFWEVEDEAGSGRINANANLMARPSTRLQLRAGLSFGRTTDSWQWVTRARADGAPFPVLGTIRQTVVSLPLRADYAFSPTLTFQLYARPFLAAGRYRDFKEVVDPAAPGFAQRFRTWDDDELARVEEGGSTRYSVDRDGDGREDLGFRNPDFNTGSLQVNAVLRWQYRPGSTLFAVWTHDRSSFGRTPFSLGGDVDRLLDAPGRSVFMLKASWWLGL